jgi:hypothetical protein
MLNPRCRAIRGLIEELSMRNILLQVRQAFPHPAATARLTPSQAKIQSSEALLEMQEAIGGAVTNKQVLCASA